MLAAKSTVKERWRQILVEADRIKEKHLCTLEPGISRDQTDEMHRHAIQLVLPASLNGTYSPEQVRSIWTVNQFVENVQRRLRVST
jgi:EcoRII C terminal.